jgi:hypothetical protein
MEEHRLKASENRVLRRIFETKRKEVKGLLIKLHNEKLHNLYFSPNIIRMIKSKRMRWKCHVAYMGVQYVGWKGKNLWNIQAQTGD